MDILAARKKAAEQAKAKREAGQAESAVTGPAAEQVAAQPSEQRQEERPPEQHQEETRQEERQEAAVAPPPESAGPPAPDTAEEEAPGTAGTPPSGEAEEAGPREIELLSFSLGGEEYAVMVEDVREVLKVYQITAVPNAPDFVLGVMSLRGVMTPILDIAKRLGLQPGVRDEKSRVVVVHTEDEHVGLLVDRVRGVLRMPADAIRPAPENIEQGGEFLRGIARKEEKLYILLDLRKAVGA